jgi:hypothetical protein
MRGGASFGVAVLLTMTLPAAGEAASSYWVVDANDQFVGEVVDLPNQFTARIRFQSGGHDFYAVAISGFWTLSTPQPPLRFLSPGCVGDPYFEAEGLESYLLPYAYWGVPTLDHLAIPDRALVPSELATQSFLDGSGVCTTSSELISVFPSFTAALPGGARPFRVIPNPNQVFADAFELGNPSHWSELGP